MKVTKPYWAIAFLFTLLGCLEEIDPRTLEFEDLLVVEGLVTDEVKNHEIRISRTFELAETEIINETGALVSLSDNFGQNIIFRENEPGVYKSEIPFAAELGRQYQLSIRTANGSEFESDIVEMIPSPEIENLEIDFIREEGTTEGEFTILLNSEPTDLDFAALRWFWEETFKFKVPNPSTLIWDGSQLIRRLPPRQLETCFATNSSTKSLVSSVISFDGSVAREPIHSFHSNTQRIAIRYSIEVSQYALNEQSFLFWDLIRRNTENQGGLFDEQPGSIKGNLRQVGDSPEQVLGIFEVGQIKRLRVFVNQSDFQLLGYDPTVNALFECSAPLRVLSEFQIPAFLEMRGGGEDLLVWYVSSGMVDPPGIFFVPKECGDCREHGVLDPPDFWID